MKGPSCKKMALTQLAITSFKLNNKTARTRCEICSKLTIKTPEERHGRLSGVIVISFEHISLCSTVFIVNFEQVNAGWVAA